MYFNWVKNIMNLFNFLSCWIIIYNEIDDWGMALKLISIKDFSSVVNIYVAIALQSIAVHFWPKRAAHFSHFNQVYKNYG